jgi:hypothetical protein
MWRMNSVASLRIRTRRWHRPTVVCTLLTNSFEYDSGSRRVRAFKMRRHRTFIGENGSLKIISVNDNVEIDLRGTDQQSVDDLLSENKS